MPRKRVHVDDYDRTREGRGEHVRDYTREQDMRADPAPSMMPLRRRGKLGTRSVKDIVERAENGIHVAQEMRRQGNEDAAMTNALEAWGMFKALEPDEQRRQPVGEELQQFWEQTWAMDADRGQLRAFRSNPDFNLALYRWQDETIEKQPKRMNNRSLGLALEHAGDIFRELTGRPNPDAAYMGEKMDRLSNILYDPYDEREIRESISPEDNALAVDVASKWMALDEARLTPEQSSLKQLGIAIAERDTDSAKRWLKQFQELRGMG